MHVNDVDIHPTNKRGHDDTVLWFRVSAVLPVDLDVCCDLDNGFLPSTILLHTVRSAAGFSVSLTVPVVARHTLFNLIISSTHIFVLFYLYGAAP